MILPASALILFISGPGQTFSISVFVDPLIEEFGWSRTSISAIYTGGSLTASVAMFGIGPLIDKYGARVMLLAVGLLMGCAAVWMSFISSKADLYLGFAGLRILGQGSLSLIGTTLIAIWFVRRRGKLTAIAGLGMVVGQALFPPLNNFVIEEWGWRSAWLILAGIVWLIAIPLGIFIVRRSPESIGSNPDGVDHIETIDASTGWSVRATTRTYAFWLLLVASVPNSLIGTALIFHQSDIFAVKELSSIVSASTLSIMGPASFAGILSAGVLADRLPNRYLIVTGQIMLSASILLIIALTEIWQAIAYGILLGYSMGFLMNVSTVIWPNYFGRKHIGSIRGIVSAVMVASAALGPLPLSLGLDWLGTYELVLLSCLVMPVLCGALAYLAKPPWTSPSGKY